MDEKNGGRFVSDPPEIDNMDERKNIKGSLLAVVSKL